MRNSPLDSIKKTADFKQVYAHGKSVSDRHFVVYAHPNEKGATRLGLSISRKVGNAVVRNKIRRWIKEFFRLNKPLLLWPSIDIVVVARMSASTLVNDTKYGGVEKSLQGLVKQIVVEA